MYNLSKNTGGNFIQAIARTQWLFQLVLPKKRQKFPVTWYFALNILPLEFRSICDLVSIFLWQSLVIRFKLTILTSFSQDYQVFAEIITIIKIKQFNVHKIKHYLIKVSSEIREKIKIFFFRGVYYKFK